MKIIKLIAFALVCSFLLGACEDDHTSVPDGANADTVAVVSNNDNAQIEFEE